MAYATLFHLNYHHSARPTYTASTIPNASAAVMALDEASSELDFVLVRAGYDAPLLSATPSSVKTFFQKANSYGALCIMERSSQVSHNEGDFCAMFKEAKKMIETGQLPGLSKNADESLPRWDAGATPPFFTRDMNL